MFNQPSNHRRMPRFVKGLFFVVVAAAGVLLFGGIVQFLWNAILPKVTSATPLNFWQAVGLLVLSRILFGGFRFGGPGGSGRPYRGGRWREKWMNMSEEERAQFKEKWRERCGKQ